LLDNFNLRTLQHKVLNDGAFVLQIMLVLRQFSLISVAVLLSKLFNINEIGKIEGLQYLLMNFTVFWINGLLQWLLPSYHNTLQEDRTVFLQRVFLIFTSLSLVIFCFFGVAKHLVFSFFLHQNPIAHHEIFFLYGLFFIPTYLLEYLYFLKKKYQQILLFSCLTFIFQNIAVIAAWYWGNSDIAWIFIIWLTLALLRFAALSSEVKIFNYSIHILIAKPYKDIVLSAFPLIAYAFIGQWAVAFDAWLVSWHYQGDTAQFAIFRYGAREFPVVMALATGLSNAASANIAENYENGIKILKVKSLRLMNWLFPLTLGLLLSSNFLFPLVFSHAFREAIVVFDIFLILIISRLLFPHTVAVGLQMFQPLLIISIAELLLNIILSAIFVQYWGIAGIAFGTWVACLFEKIAIAAWVFYKRQISIREYTAWNRWLLYSVLLLISFVLKYY
jgi:O-antigen/teichoic acid export membrane protein